jgi:tetratricopeptide (TPR) repeat protein
MKRVAMVLAILAIASFTFAQAPQGQNPPAQNPPAGAQQPGAQGGAQAAPGNRPPQAKTQPEYDAFNAANAAKDPESMEKAATDFAAKFPDSELRILLFKNVTRAYQNANNADKMLEMARKSLEVDPDDAESLVDVAEVLAERTRDTDLDKDQRLDEARKNVDHALQSVDTHVPVGVPADKMDTYKGLLRSTAYSVRGTLLFNKGDFPGAEGDFRKSIDAFPQQPDPITILRLSLALDRQNKYPEALTYANKAVELTQEGSSAGTLARRERDRLVQLTGGKPAGAPGATAPQNQTIPPQNQTIPPK